MEYAKYLGIDPIREKDLLYIAKEGLKAPLPSDWKPIQDQHGDVYYHNFETEETKVEHPCDEYYRNLVLKEREKKMNKMVEKTIKKQFE